jgi:DNA-binding CsgD family transcriptional regulator
MTRLDHTATALAFLEAAYAWQLSDDRWLRGLIAATRGLWGRPRWICAYEYDVSVAGRFALGPVQFWGARAPIRRLMIERITDKGVEMAPHYRTVGVGYARPMGGVNEADAKALATADTADYFGLNGLDGSGQGCFIGIGAERTALDAREMVLFSRLAAHLASAYRCRRRLKATASDPIDDCEAIVSADGKLLEVRGAATGRAARASIGEAARDLQRLRSGRLREGPTERWRPRVSSRWTLVASYARGGERYLLARENQTRLPGLHVLTEREQQVVASALTGKSNKEIAYDLGVSHSTARVLLARALARLGVHSRADLFALPGIRALRGDPP